MKTLHQQCCELLRVPIRVQIAWIDQDRNAPDSAWETVTEIRRLCQSFLREQAAADDVGWVFGYVEECRNAYRSGTKLRKTSDMADVADPSTVVSVDRDAGDGAEQLLALIDRSARRFATAEQKKRFQSFRNSGSKSSAGQSRRFNVSRATLHESVEKARHIGLAGVLLLAAEDPDGQFDAVLFSSPFALATPYTAQTFGGFESILTNHSSRMKRNTAQLARGFTRLWDRGNAVLHRELAQGTPDVDAVISLIHTVCFVHTLTAQWGGLQFDAAFAETWNLLRRFGALDRRPFRQLYASVGSYCGSEQHQLEFLRDPEASLVELSGFLGFVRGVTQPGRPVTTRRFLTDPLGLLDEFAATLDGCVAADPSRAATPDASFARKVWDVANRYLNNARHRNPGSSRKVLAWLEAWLTLLNDRRLPADPVRCGKVKRSLEQYGPRLCTTPDHAQAFSRVMEKLSPLAG